MAFSFEGRDESAGILGRLTPGAAVPVAVADTLEQLQREARAYLGDEPAAFLYLVDADGGVRAIVINRKYHEATEKAERRTAIATALLVLCVTSLLGATLGSLGGWALLGFVTAAGLYALILLAGLFNEIEGAVVCEMLLILALLMVSAVQRGRSAAERVDAPVSLRGPHVPVKTNAP
jgi:hypothetical protein